MGKAKTKKTSFVRLDLFLSLAVRSVEMEHFLKISFGHDAVFQSAALMTTCCFRILAIFLFLSSFLFFDFSFLGSLLLFLVQIPSFLVSPPSLSTLFLLSPLKISRDFLLLSSEIYLLSCH